MITPIKYVVNALQMLAVVIGRVSRKQKWKAGSVNF